MGKKKLNIAVVGYGFMGKAHSNAWRQAARFFDLPFEPVLKVLCGRDEAKARAFADNWGFEAVENDWRQAVARDDVDLVDVCLPNNLHRDVAIEAANAGKWLTLEKPLAMDAAQGQEMVDAVNAAGVPNMVWYNYRRLPAVSLARQAVREGRIGKPFHYRARFLQDWTMSPDLPQGGAALWRLEGDSAGSGVTGDLLAHNIDTAMWLNGPIASVMATTETFIKERPDALSGEKKPVTIDDACMFLCRFANGSLGLFESTRYARGHKALKTFELNGMDGSVGFDLHEPEYLNFFEYNSKESGQKSPDHLNGWRKVHVTNPEHPYMGRWWVPGLVIGYEHSFVHAAADFLVACEGGAMDGGFGPTFEDALQTQKVCEAVLESAKAGAWRDTGAKPLRDAAV